MGASLAESMRVRASRQTVGPAAAALLAGLALTACGEGRSFTAEEFVDEVKAEGVEAELGDELFTDDEDAEVYALELEPVAKLPGADEHAGGSLSVYADGDGADEKYESCQGSADLLCYRAANVVVVLEGGGIEAERLGVAMERLESG